MDNSNKVFPNKKADKLIFLMVKIAIVLAVVIVSIEFGRSQEKKQWEKAILANNICITTNITKNVLIKEN